MIDTMPTLPMSRSSRRADCADCKRRARPGRQTCKACGDRKESFSRAPRVTLICRCTLCGSVNHASVWCPLRDRGES